MDDPQDVISRLKKQLIESENNLSLAAHYGKDLLEENASIHSKLDDKIKEFGLKTEKYEQEIYSKSLLISAKQETILSQQSEIENIDSENKDSITQITADYDIKINHLNEKLKEKNNAIDIFESEIAIHTEQIKELENLLEESKLQRNQCLSSAEETLDETFTQQNQIKILTNENQDLEARLTKIKSQFKSSQLECGRFHNTLELKNQELEEKECKITSLYNSVEKEKENMVEIQMELDNLKMSEIDPYRKGNSLFAEVEDNRQLLEKKVLSLNIKCSTLLNQNEIKTRQVSTMKLQIASLLSLNTSSEKDLEYQKSLEESLFSTKKQLQEFSRRCKELEANQSSSMSMNVTEIDKSESSSGNLFKYLFEESKIKVSVLEEEISSLRFNKVSLEDKLLQMKRKLYQKEGENDLTTSELIKLRVRLEELMLSNGLKEDEFEDKIIEVVEKLPFEIDQNKPKQVPIVENFCKPGAMKLTKDLSNNTSTVEKENITKKVKKSVKMADSIIVKEHDSNVEKLEKLIEKPVKKVERIRKPLRVMEAPLAKQMSTEEQSQCNQQ